MRPRRRVDFPRLQRWPARLPHASRILWSRLALQRHPAMSVRAKAGWLLALALLFTSYVPGDAQGPRDRERMIAGVRMFFSPQTDLSRIDRELIGSAKRQIDFAAYVLTDRSIMNALIEAAGRGVKIRIYLDPDQPASRTRDQSSPFWTLLRSANVEHKMKTGGRDLMHLKAYQVDGRMLRTGSANFSFSGPRFQDNDLLLIEGRDAIARFQKNFEAIWSRPANVPFPPPDGQR